MARMHPSQLTDAFTGFSVPAERAVYEKAARELSDDFHIFHDLKWDDPGLADYKNRGQIDFVMAHPEYGFIAIEVKGGRCRYEPDLRTWTTIDGDNVSHDITDPFEQAATAARIIRKLLSAQPKLTSTYLPHHSAVIFPDCVLKKANLRADILAWQILDQEGMFDFRRTVHNLFVQAFPQRIKPDLGTRIIQGLRHLYGDTPLDGKRNRSQRLRRVEDAIISLTENQLGVLRQLRDARRMLIQGCAGSGKTTLAIHKAKMAAEQGKDVLLVCFNEPLAAYLKRACASHQTITVGSFHNLCMCWLDRIGRSCQPEDTNAFYDETLPSLMVDAIDEFPIHFDAIIVDEGQDFKDTYYLVLELFFREPDEAIFYIFADSSQNIYAGTQQYPMSLFPFRLEQNLRNTNQVFQVVKHACELPDDIQPSGVTGPPVQLLTYDSDNTMMATLEELLGHLIAEGITPSDIVILGTRAQYRTMLKHGRKIGPCELVPTRTERNQLLTMTIHRFKGLESQVVIICELDETIQFHEKELLYIGMTRSTGLLYLLVRASAEQHFRRLFGL